MLLYSSDGEFRIPIKYVLKVVTCAVVSLAGHGRCVSSSPIVLRILPRHFSPISSWYKKTSSYDNYDKSIYNYDDNNNNKKKRKTSMSRESPVKNVLVTIPVF